MNDIIMLPKEKTRKMYPCLWARHAKKEKKMMKKTLAGMICVLLVFAFVVSALAQAPTLSLLKAVELAQKTLAATNKIKVDNYYLFSVILTNSSRGSFWYHTYRAIQPSEYNQIFAKVFMDGTVQLSGGPFVQE